MTTGNAVGIIRPNQRTAIPDAGGYELSDRWQELEAEFQSIEIRQSIRWRGGTGRAHRETGAVNSLHRTASRPCSHQ